MPLTVQTPRVPAPPLPWLASGQAFPPLEAAWGDADPAPGLLAMGETLDVATLLRAYAQGIFPWFSELMMLVVMVWRISDWDCIACSFRGWTRNWVQ